jgi:hypothetical protein
MSSPRLPSHAEDIWECSFLLNPPTAVNAVSAPGGLLIAGGDRMYMLRPGAQRMASRETPLDIGLINVVAAEPRPPWRYAVASDEMVAIFFKNKQGEQIMWVRSPGPTPTHLAWGRSGNAFTLFIRWSDGGVLRVNPDMKGSDPLDLPPIEALAADSSGTLALLSFDPDEPRAYVTKDGETLAFRALPSELGLDYDQEVNLAVADAAVAFSIENGGTFVSRTIDGPFAPCPPLATMGPLEFQGSSSDAALFGAIPGAAFASILRVDEKGSASAIAELGNDAGDSPTLLDLSWDSSRHTLWTASPEAGILSCTAPSSKGKKKVQLS